MYVRAAQSAECGGGPDAAVHVAAAADERRLIPARDRAGGDHRIGKRRVRRVLAAEEHMPPAVIVHGRDPGMAVDPVRRGLAAEGMVALLMAPVQRADQRPERRVPAPAVRQPATRTYPRRDLKRPQQGRTRQRQRTEAQVRDRGQRAVLRGELDGLAQDPAGVPALPCHHFLDRSAAAQGGGQHAACAGPDDEVNVGGVDWESVLQAGQRAGHPGRAEHAARAEHQADWGARGVGAADGPVRTKNDSRHICLRNPPTCNAGRRR